MMANAKKVAGAQGKADRTLLKDYSDEVYREVIAAAKREGARAALRAVDKTLQPNRKSKYLTAQLVKLD